METNELPEAIRPGLRERVADYIVAFLTYMDDGLGILDEED